MKRKRAAIAFGILTVCMLIVIFVLSAQKGSDSAVISDYITWNIIEHYEPNEHPENPLLNDQSSQTSEISADSSGKTVEAVTADSRNTSVTAEVPNSAETLEDANTPEPEEAPFPLPKHRLFGIDRYHLRTFVRKWAHIVLYAALGVLTFLTAYLALPKYRAAALPAAILFCTVCGAFDELHQYFVPGRSAEFKDIGIDALGSLIGITAAALVCLIVMLLRRFMRKAR